MHGLLLALIIGFVCGLRALLGLVAVSWAARLHVLHLEDTFLAFFGYRATPYVLTALGLAEMVNDKLPKTPSRTIPPQFITRVVTGSLSGAAIGASNQQTVLGAVCGGLGAIAGTLAGAKARGALARAIGKDLPAALIEDVVAIGLAFAAFLTLA